MLRLFWFCLSHITSKHYWIYFQHNFTSTTVFLLSLSGSFPLHFCGCFLLPLPTIDCLHISSLSPRSPVSLFFFAVSTSMVLMAAKLSSPTSSRFCLRATELAKIAGAHPLTAVRSRLSLFIPWSCMRGEKDKKSQWIASSGVLCPVFSVCLSFETSLRNRLCLGD